MKNFFIKLRLRLFGTRDINVYRFAPTMSCDEARKQVPKRGTLEFHIDEKTGNYYFTLIGKIRSEGVYCTDKYGINTNIFYVRIYTNKK